MSSEEKGRLARWSQRKAEARPRGGGAAPATPEELAAPPLATGAAKDDPYAGADSKAPPATEHDLPDIESLTPGSDFTAFMKEGVPAGLRRLALRKLWASDPMFNVIDEMVEYGEDYSRVATVIEGAKTAVDAGRGLLGGNRRNDSGDGSATERTREQDTVVDGPGDPDQATARDADEDADEDPDLASG